MSAVVARLAVVLATGLAVLSTIIPMQASAADAVDAAVPNCAPDGVGVGGFDLVSYRVPGGPVPGLAEHVAHVDGLDYRFVSAEHLAQFLADPERYLPVYSGWCAATLSFGKLACPEYRNFALEDDRLLLFEHTGFTNGRTLWNSDPLAHRQRADRFFKLLNP
ncbi:MAG: twin-arginine translocation pathway signal protein [Pseudomonadales bacterium]